MEYHKYREEFLSVPALSLLCHILPLYYHQYPALDAGYHFVFPSLWAVANLACREDKRMERIVEISDDSPFLYSLVEQR